MNNPHHDQQNPAMVLTVFFIGLVTLAILIGGGLFGYQWWHKKQIQKQHNECVRQAATSGQSRLGYYSDQDNFAKLEVDFTRCEIRYPTE